EGSRSRSPFELVRAHHFPPTKLQGQSTHIAARVCSYMCLCKAPFAWRPNSKRSFLLCTCCVSAKISCEDTRPLRITLMVIRMIRKSSPSDALRTYHSSIFSFSSLVTSLAPLTCAHPLIPGRTDSLTDVFAG